MSGGRITHDAGNAARRSMIPVPQPLLVTLASLDHDAARSMFGKKVENGKYVTGLDHRLDPVDPHPICIVLEPVHDRDFPNGVEWKWGYTAQDCERLSKYITSNSRRFRGPNDGWIMIDDFDNSVSAWDTRLLLLACCYGRKPRVELMITSNAYPRHDIIIIKGGRKHGPCDHSDRVQSSNYQGGQTQHGGGATTGTSKTSVENAFQRQNLQRKRTEYLAREEARAKRDLTPEPPHWESGDVFHGVRGVVEEKGSTQEGESENLSRRLNEFLERQGRNQSHTEDEAEDLPAADDERKDKAEA
eukprot:2454788-Amphidinium_carterae.2